MEIRKESIGVLKLCRFCLCQDDTLTSLYEKDRTPRNSVTLPLKILSCVSIEVFPSDRMPSYICSRCKFFMEVSYEFKQICRSADEKILQYIQNATALTAVPWNHMLLKIHNDAKPEAMKTVVEDGTTIQVTANESDSDEEEDNENVYNIKIGDGSDDGSKNTRVKVITAKEKESPKKKGKDFEAIEDENDDVTRLDDLQEGCWPCDECDCTYPLQQLLELHKRQKHKARSLQCDKCDAKFFSNYDLISHQLRHSDEMLFQCVACDKQFKRLIRLKRHEKIVHADIPQQSCPNCPATFLSLEELEAHQVKHVRNPERRYICPICDKRFIEKGTLQRHKENIHDKSPEFSCEYCPQQFTTVSKLTRHVRAHASERAYPCKYCEKSFLKSHHYTRHLRLKHRETIRSCRGPFGEADQYRCEQCEDTFATQDELIYHSAIHATQNLTCPLCQEQFQNVDAVTAHIKSHVNGTEFMCELCELIFTSREKLDLHISIAHDDEIHNQDLGQDESSTEMDVDEDEDDNTINVKEEGDHMLVEIKKSDGFMITDSVDNEEKNENTNSEESETETSYTELATVDTLAVVSEETSIVMPSSATAKDPAPAPVAKTIVKDIDQTLTILKKADEIKRKQLITETTPIKKDKSNNKAEGGNIVGASDKSLRLLEKELQELKRTNIRNEAGKVASKSMDGLKNRRPQIHTSTPKIRPVEEKKVQMSTKSPALEKKIPERRVMPKENKEPKETKDSKVNNTLKEEKDAKEKDTPKNVVKNGASDKNGSEESIRRSTRPSKIKDYAKMIKDKSQDSDDEDSDESDEYEEIEKIDYRPKPRRSSAKPPPKIVQAPPISPTMPTPPRKRGRPRKDANVPSKFIKKEESNEKEKTGKTESVSENKIKKDLSEKDIETKKYSADSSNRLEANKSSEQKNSPDVLVSPTGQTLKKVPIKSLPPGVKPLPLPLNARPIGSGEVCEMQIGKKVVKVQKIVMTKAEVDAMAKKGLVEVKDGTMVLKQGIKLTSDTIGLKSTLLREEPSKESPVKKDKPTPTRCDLEDA